MCNRSKGGGVLLYMKNTFFCIDKNMILLQGRKLSTATAASAIDALQLAEVPLKIYPYSRTKWPGPPTLLAVVPLSGPLRNSHHK